MSRSNRKESIVVLRIEETVVRVWPGSNRHVVDGVCKAVINELTPEGILVARNRPPGTVNVVPQRGKRRGKEIRYGAFRSSEFADGEGRYPGKVTVFSGSFRNTHNSDSVEQGAFYVATHELCHGMKQSAGSSEGKEQHAHEYAVGRTRRMFRA